MLSLLPSPITLNKTVTTLSLHQVAFVATWHDPWRPWSPQTQIHSTSAVAYDFHLWSSPPACSGHFLPTGEKKPFSHLLPQVVLSLHPTHIVHLLVLAEHSSTTNALTDRPNPANDPYEMETDAIFLSHCFSPRRLESHPVGFTSLFLQLLTLVSDSSLLPAGLLFVPACLCAERWRSLCGTWWCCWHVSSPLDAAIARGSVWPAVCSYSSRSCSMPSTPWWVCTVRVCVCVDVSHCW